MATKIQLRRDTSSSWTSANPILSQGEPGIETNTGKMKVGDGTTAWTSLSYLAACGSASCASWDSLTNKNNASGPASIALGTFAGSICQSTDAIAIGVSAGTTSQHQHAVAVGFGAGNVSQMCRAISIGYNAGGDAQLADGIAIGTNAGFTMQCNDSIAIGTCAGHCHQGEESVAIGIGAGFKCQQRNAIAIGRYAGSFMQGTNSVAIGHYAGGTGGGTTPQGHCSVAIGMNAGTNQQGNIAVAIGPQAGSSLQPDHSIMINAGCGALNGTNSGLYVDPVRSCGSSVSSTVYYNASTKEMTYGPSGNSVVIPSAVSTALGITAVSITTASCQQGGSCNASVTWNVNTNGPIISSGLVVTAGGSGNPVVTGTTTTGCQTVGIVVPGNGTPYTVYAYLQTPFTTVFSAPASGTSGICFVKGTMIALSDGTYKPIEDIVYSDLLLVWNFDLGRYAEASPIWIKAVETESSYNLLTFSNGSTLRTSGNHHIFNKDAKRFTHTMRDDTPIGSVTVDEHGTELTLVSTEVVAAAVETYNVFTEYHLNMYADGILTSNRFNNTYPIENMQFVKTAGVLRPLLEFAGIDKKWIDGLRLREQTADHTTAYIRWYMRRLEHYDVNSLVSI